MTLRLFAAAAAGGLALGVAAIVATVEWLLPALGY